MAGAGSVGSSAGTYTACTDVIAPLSVEAIRSCKCAHFRGQCRLVTDRRRHPAEQCGDFASRLRETEDIVDEQERVGPGRVAKVLGHRQGRECHAQTGTGRLVHLPEDHAGLVDHAAARVADLGLLHFEPQVGPFAGPLADAGEYRVATVGASDTGDQLGQDHRLAEPGPAEQPALPPRTNGVSRSMTLMPVSNISVLVDSSVNGGRIAVDRPAFRRHRPGRGRRPARPAG